VFLPLPGQREQGFRELGGGGHGLLPGLHGSALTYSVSPPASMTLVVRTIMS
jgi:hypothetical protein